MSEELDDKTLVETVGKYDIYFTPMTEYQDPVAWQDFENDEQKAEYIRQLENYIILVFCARITIEIKGIELASTYLGMCEYHNYSDFYLNEDGTTISNDCYADMKDEAIEEAEKTLKELTAA